MGLFTGMSFLSLVEIVYWMAKLTVKAIKTRRRPKVVASSEKGYNSKSW